MGSVIYKDRMPYIILLLCFLPTLLSYYFNVPIFKQIASELNTWSSLALSTALFLGLANLLIHNYRLVKERKSGEWQFGVYTVALTILWIVLGLLAGGLASPDYQQAYVYIKAQCWSAQIGLMAFFFVSAAYRVLRVFRPQGLALLVTFFISLIAVSPWGEALWPGFPSFGAWVLDNIAMAASRGIIIAAGIGLVAMVTRIILRYEKGGLTR